MTTKIDLTISVVPEMLEPIDVLAHKFHWTREQAVVQMIDDWAQTFAWQDECHGVVQRWCDIHGALPRSHEEILDEAQGLMPSG